MTFSPKPIFQGDPRHEGVPRINIYLLRLLYILMFFVLGKETWTHILTYPEYQISPEQVAASRKMLLAPLQGASWPNSMAGNSETALRLKAGQYPQTWS